MNVLNSMFQNPLRQFRRPFSGASSRPTGCRPLPWIGVLGLLIALLPTRADGLPSLRIETQPAGGGVVTSIRPLPQAGAPVPAAADLVLEATSSLDPDTPWHALPWNGGPVDAPSATVSADASVRYFRLRWSDAILATRDSDGDGINDLDELQHRAWLDPLVPNAPDSDWDRDGVPDRDELAAGTDPADFAGQLATTPDGQRHYAIKADGSMWGWGNNDLGRLGDGGSAYQPAPVRIGAERSWRFVATSGTHALAVARDGSLWSWGSNPNGELGDGGTVDRLVPAPAAPGQHWRAVAAGSGFRGGFSAAIRDDGTLWQWGAPFDFAAPNQPQPTQVGTNADWTSIGAGRNHLVARRGNGTLWHWGFNDGSLGPDAIMPVPAPLAVDAATDWARVRAGNGFSIGFKSDGTAWAWGLLPFPLSFGVSGTPVPLSVGRSWRDVTIGDAEHAESAIHAIAPNGSLWVWGSLRDASGSPQPVNEPQLVARGTKWQTFANASSPLARRADGTLWSLSSGQAVVRTVPQRVGSDRDWVDVSAGTYGSLAWKRDGSLWTFGGTRYWPANAPLRASMAVPVAIEPGMTWLRGSHTPWRDLLIRGDGSLWLVGETIRYFGGAWVGGGTIGGGCEHGCPGGTWVPAQSPEPSLTPMAYGGAGRWQSIALGLDHAAGIQADGSLWHWGLFPRLATENTGSRAAANVPVRVGTDLHWAKVVSGDNHLLALTAAGSLWAWGTNDHGQLGDGSRILRAEPVRIGAAGEWRDVAAGATHSVGLKSDGSVWTWGDNANGQRGVAGTSDQLAPAALASSGWQRIFAGAGQTFALRADGSLWAWGDNRQGQLGVGEVLARVTPRPVGGSAGWVSVSTAASHTLAVKADGSLWGWGNAWFGAIGDQTVEQAPLVAAPGNGW